MRRIWRKSTFNSGCGHLLWKIYWKLNFLINLIKKLKIQVVKILFTKLTTKVKLKFTLNYIELCNSIVFVKFYLYFYSKFIKSLKIHWFHPNNQILFFFTKSSNCTAFYFIYHYYYDDDYLTHISFPLCYVLVNR